jgi:hypothetical protein
MLAMPDREAVKAWSFHGLRELKFDLAPAAGLNEEGSRNFSAAAPDPDKATSTAAAGLTASCERELSLVAAASRLSLV